MPSNAVFPILYLQAAATAEYIEKRIAVTEYEKKLLSQIQESYSRGEYHKCFDLPKHPKEAEKLLSALHALEDAAQIFIIASPEDGYDDITVELCPSCLKPSPDK